MGIWKFIRKGWEEFSSFTRFEGGDSSKVSFLQDFWCEVLPLKGAFPELFSIACLRDASVEDNLQFSNSSSQWNANFIRAAHDWELKFFTLFFNQLYSISLRQDSVNKLYWTPSKRGQFEVSMFCNILIPLGIMFFPSKVYLAE